MFTHSNLPWKVEPYNSYDKWIHINDDLIRVNNDDMPDGEGEANAHFIAKACNNYENLRKVLGMIATGMFNEKEAQLLASEAIKEI